MTYVQQMRGYFAVGLGPHKSYRQHHHTIEQLTRAITQTRTVQMRYYSASRDKTGRREVDPYRLWYVDGGLYLIAYCHRRRDVRLFAVDRIRSLTITNLPCQMPLGSIWKRMYGMRWWLCGGNRLRWSCCSTDQLRPR